VERTLLVVHSISVFVCVSVSSDEVLENSTLGLN
jgi:hypothetical protein